MIPSVAQVNLLDTTVLTNNVQDVQALFNEYHEFEFTAHALGLAMRFCGVDMVATLFENGATLSFMPTDTLRRVYLDELPQAWGGRSYDFAKYLFPAMGPLKDDMAGRDLISAAQRQAIIEYLVSKNIPELPSFLYYSILAGDDAVYTYLRAQNFTGLPSPYMEIVEGLLSEKEVEQINASSIVNELKRQMRITEDADLAVMLKRLIACVPQHKISVSRYDLLLPTRACSGDLFPILADGSDLPRKINRQYLLSLIVENNNIAGLEYVLTHNWLKTPNELKHLSALVRGTENPSPEMMARVLQMTEDNSAEEGNGANNKKDATDELSLDAAPKPLTLAEARQDWDIRKTGNREYEICSYKGWDTHVVVPELVGRGVVTSIDPGTFELGGLWVTGAAHAARKAIKSIELPGSIQVISGVLFSGFGSGKQLREVIFHEGVREINDGAFFGCPNLSVVSFPTTLVRIGDEAFQNCVTLGNISLPSSLVHIGNEAFENCEALRAVSLPDSLETLGARAFESTDLRQISFPPKLRHIGDHAFQDCEALTSATFHDGLESLGNGAFDGTGLKEVNLPATLEIVGERAFSDCDSLRAVHFAEGSSAPLRIGDGAFQFDISLSTVVFPSNLESIGECAFLECSIESLDIPEDTKSIGEEAFKECKKLKTVHIPSNTRLGFEAFLSCDGLADQNGAIVVNHTLFGVAKEDSIDRRLTPLELGPEIHAVGTSAFALPQIVYRSPETQPTPPDLSALETGSRVWFGRFPAQTNFALQDLPWLVLSVQGEKALLITENAIMARLYPARMDRDWTTSTARKLLNGAFMDVAFTPEERSLIALTNTTPVRSSATEDYVFLLSVSEARRYLKNPTSLAAMASPYACAQSDEEEEYEADEHVEWLLRTYGKDVAYVDFDGDIVYEDDPSDWETVFFRPAMWIRLS